RMGPLVQFLANREVMIAVNKKVSAEDTVVKDGDIVKLSHQSRVSYDGTRDIPVLQDAEKARQFRSHLESILNVAQRLRLRCFHRLRPCWTAFLSILRERSSLVLPVRAIEVLACQAE
ncbi:MAG: hypothetical protein ACREIJ_11480, partial [Nitrospiraceae bacterium]